MFQFVLLDNPFIKVLLKKEVIPYSGQLRKHTLIKNAGRCAKKKKGKKKKLLKDSTEVLLAAAEATDTGGLSLQTL